MVVRIVVAPLLVLLVFLTACETESPTISPTSKTQLLEVHLWQVFEDDAVRVALDGEPIFEGVVSTNHIFTLAKRIPTRVAQGDHELKITVNKRWTGAVRFAVEKPLYIGVSFFRNRADGPFDFRFLDEEPLYY
jgi:hypothetical protein